MKNRVPYSAQCLIIFGFGQEFSFRCIPTNLAKSHDIMHCVCVCVIYTVEFLPIWVQISLNPNTFDNLQLDRPLE